MKIRLVEDYDNRPQILMLGDQIENMIGNMSDEDIDKSLRVYRNVAKILGVKRYDDVWFFRTDDEYDPRNYKLEKQTLGRRNILVVYKIPFLDVRFVAEDWNNTTYLYFATEDDAITYINWVDDTNRWEEPNDDVVEEDYEGKTKVFWKRGNIAIIRDGYGLGIDNGTTVNRFFIDNDGQPKFDYKPAQYLLDIIKRLIKNHKFDNPNYNQNNPQFVKDTFKYESLEKGTEESVENDDALKEQALARSDAMNRCINLGNQFVAHFDKIYNDNNEETIKHHAMEMQGWLDQANNIVLKHNNRPLSADQKINWFFTVGSESEKLFPDNATEQGVFDDFVDSVYRTNNVEQSLKDLDLLNESLKNIEEDLDSDVMTSDKVEIEEVGETSDKGPDVGIDSGIASMLIQAINDEWTTNDKYNGIIATLTDFVNNNDFDSKLGNDMIAIIQDINKEELTHIGQLQKCLYMIAPNTEAIADGEQEAEEQINQL